MANEAMMAVHGGQGAQRGWGVRFAQALIDGLVRPLVMMTVVACPVFGLVALAGLAFAG